jgi:hypothetical protein
VSDEQAPREIDRDFGLGARVSQQRGLRFLNRDGSFNVKRRHLSFVRSLSLYHWLLTVSWTRFFVAVGTFYLAYNCCSPPAITCAARARCGAAPSRRVAAWPIASSSASTPRPPSATATSAPTACPPTCW